jgi:PAS domain S-box-containing protein
MDALSPTAGWERLFWEVFERSANGIALVDEHRRYIEANDGVAAILGRGRGELLGRHVYEFIRPADRERASREWHDLLRTGELSAHRVFVRSDGTEVDVELAARLAVIGGRRVAVFVVVHTGDEPESPGEVDGPVLTEREMEIVAHIAMGKDTAAMAELLHISPETVRTHVRNAMGKLGAHTRAELVAKALSYSMLETLPRTG